MREFKNASKSCINFTYRQTKLYDPRPFPVSAVECQWLGLIAQQAQSNGQQFDTGTREEQGFSIKCGSSRMWTTQRRRRRATLHRTSRREKNVADVTLDVASGRRRSFDRRMIESNHVRHVAVSYGGHGYNGPPEPVRNWLEVWLRRPSLGKVNSAWK